jgi:8-oxo-dGTP pyrophosphatase MutT (NUDIX family)
MKKEASLCLIEDTENHKFAMVRNHRGINKGCINFPGGKKEPGETMEECACRETFEETGLTIKNPAKVGYVEFPTMDFYVHVYKCSDFSGSLKESSDEVDVFWQDADKIPYDQMRAADKDFLPLILAGKYVRKSYFYDENFQIEKVVDLDKEPENL